MDLSVIHYSCLMAFSCCCGRFCTCQEDHVPILLFSSEEFASVSSPPGNARVLIPPLSIPIVS